MDFGPYGKGTTGYVHYKQAFDRAQKNQGGGGPPGNNNGCLQCLLLVVLPIAHLITALVK